MQIHHSRDLVNWRLVTRPLDRAAQLDMRGEPDSGGVWAPCLSHADGKFWLVYTDVKRLDGNFKDAHNYIVTAPSIEGPWSDPIYVNSSGFDPSLFHDDDGRKWFVNMVWNHRDPPPKPRRHPAFFGIALQEWDPVGAGLIGEAKTIFAGSAHGLVEGPHLFKRNGWYYLTTAEGGTGYDHAVTMARSRSIDGPYELHPDTHLITSKDAPDAPLQRAGHGQIVETPDGQVYHTHLCSRPLAGAGARRSAARRRSRNASGATTAGSISPAAGRFPRVEVPPPAPVRAGAEAAAIRATRSRPDGLPPDFQWLRTPYPERIFSLAARPGLAAADRARIDRLVVRAGACRAPAGAFRLSRRDGTRLRAADFQQAAGLDPYYNRSKFHFLAVTWDESIGRALTILSCAGDYPEGRLMFPPPPIRARTGPGQARASVDRAELQFAGLRRTNASAAGRRSARPSTPRSSPTRPGGGEHGSFTGAFVGMFAFDISGAGAAADFAFFAYEGLD